MEAGSGPPCFSEGKSLMKGIVGDGVSSGTEYLRKV